MKTSVVFGAAAVVSLCGWTHGALAQGCDRFYKFNPAFGFKANGNTPEVRDTAIWDADGPGPGAPRLVLAGSLTSLNDTTYNEMLIAFDPVANEFAPVGGGFRDGDGSATAVAVSPSGQVFVAGPMGQLGGMPGGGPQVTVNGIARWDGTQWLPLGSGLQSVGCFCIWDMAFAPSGDLIVVGAFDSIGGVPNTSRVARWDGSAWHAVGTGFPSGALLRSVAIDRFGVIYVGGSMATTSAGVVVNNVSRFVGGQWQAMGGGVSSDVLKVLIDPVTDQPIISGNFLTNEPSVPQFQQTRIARWDGTAWRRLGASEQVSGDIDILPDATIIANFGAAIQGYNRTSNLWVPISPLVSGLQLPIVLPDGDIALVGNFQAINGQTAPRLVRYGRPAECPMVEARFDADTVLNNGWITTWNGGSGGTVLSTSAGELSPASEAIAAANAGNLVQFKSSAAWRGDKRGLQGGHIRVVADNRAAGLCNGPSGDVVANLILEGQGLTLVRQTATASKLRDRETISASLIASDGWRVGDMNGPPASAQQMYDVLSRLLSIKVAMNIPQAPGCPAGEGGRQFDLDSVQVFTIAPKTSFNFADSVQGWSGDGDTTSITLSEPGVLRSTENPTGPWRNYVVADSGLGHFSQFFGDSILYKLRTSIVQDNEVRPVLSLESADGTILHYSSPQVPDTQNFSIFSIPLRDIPFQNNTGWFIENSTQQITEAIMRSVLDDLVAIRIRAEFSQTGDTCFLKDYLITTTFSGNLCDSVDFNNDGIEQDPTDLEAFFSVYSGGPCVPSTSTCADIDFNNDGIEQDPTDLEAFFSVYSGGPCL